MPILPQIIEAHYVSGYRIGLVFNTGLQKTVDFSHWLKGPVFEPLKSPLNSANSLSQAERCVGQTEQTSRQKHCFPFAECQNTPPDG